MKWSRETRERTFCRIRISQAHNGLPDPRSCDFVAQQSLREVEGSRTGGPGSVAPHFRVGRAGKRVLGRSQGRLRCLRESKGTVPGSVFRDPFFWEGRTPEVITVPIQANAGTASYVP